MARFKALVETSMQASSGVDDARAQLDTACDAPHPSYELQD